MKKTNINITSNTVIEAHGIHTNGNCKAIFCIEKGKVYTSMTDAAMDLGCSLDAVSNVIRNKQKTCKGYHLVLMSKANEALPQMAERLSEIDMLRAKAIAYDKLMAEQKAKEEAEAKRLERERKAEEKRKAEITKLENKIERLESLIDRERDKTQKLVDKRNKALAELEALMDNGKEVA